jgi:phosphatidylserine/phosphatidylglycerophosphate/cardiolipin synthase-like enzyme
MIGFAAPEAVTSALARAHSVSCSAYVLDPRGAICRALESAGDRGAAVDVTLEAFNGATARPGSAGLQRLARETATALRAHGVQVHLGLPSGDLVHLKAAVVDGVAYLDDRNWSADGETIVADSQPDDVAAVRDAIEGRFSKSTSLATEKSAALALEAAAVSAGAGDRIDVETESFGGGSISSALRARAAGGAHVRLLVNGKIAFARSSARERAVLHGLAKAGVEIRTTAAREKVCVAGDRGWVGSANATYAGEPTTDWGIAIRDPAMLDTLESTFARSWETARPFV